MIKFVIGDSVKIRTTRNFPLGGWIHGEIAKVVHVDEWAEMLTIELKNELLRSAIKQDISDPCFLKISFENAIHINS